MNRCPSTHNPGVWPHVARCVRPAGHPTDGLMGHMHPSVHVDGHGQTWHVGSAVDVPVTDLPPTDRVVHSVPGEVGPEVLRDDLTELECGHCGSINTVAPVTFPEGQRFLCQPCRTEMLAWI